MTLDLIPAAAYSLEDLNDLYNRARADYLVPMPMTPESLSLYIVRHSLDLNASRVATLNGEPAGLALLGLRGERAWLTRMGVLREARRAGVGRALVEGVLDVAWAGGAVEAQLEVISDNAIGLRLFRNCGFAPVRRLQVLERMEGLPEALDVIPDRTLTTPDAVAWLENSGIGYAPSWTEETASLRRARRLSGLVLGDAAVIYGDDGSQLTPVVLCRADEVTGPALLTALHERMPGRPAIKENLPEGDVQADWFAVAGYGLAFTRVEMRRTL